MTDVHSKETRSYNMSRIRAKDTKPELLVRKYLFSKGFRYRLNVKKLPGKPDIVFTKYNTVIFINGCFWHGHENCPKARIPKTKTEWWKAKITKEPGTGPARICSIEATRLAGACRLGMPACSQEKSADTSGPGRRPLPANTGYLPKTAFLCSGRTPFVTGCRARNFI